MRTTLYLLMLIGSGCAVASAVMIGGAPFWMTLAGVSNLREAFSQKQKVSYG